jgi:hypothetical protein
MVSRRAVASSWVRDEGLCVMSCLSTVVYSARPHQRKFGVFFATFSWCIFRDGSDGAGRTRNTTTWRSRPARPLPRAW